jgi:hypothetical protein
MVGHWCSESLLIVFESGSRRHVPLGMKEQSNLQTSGYHSLNLYHTHQVSSPLLLIIYLISPAMAFNNAASSTFDCHLQLAQQEDFAGQMMHFTLRTTALPNLSALARMELVTLTAAFEDNTTERICMVHNSFMIPLMVINKSPPSFSRFH